MSIPDLRTPRLVLRQITVQDEPAVHAYAADPDVCRYTLWGPNTAAQTRAFMDEVVLAAHDDDPVSRTWGIAGPDGVLVGACSVDLTSRQHRRGELGYVVAREHWCRGYATEAARAVLGFAIHDLGLARVSATCRPDNRASARVLEKIGMTFEGTMRSHVVVRGQRQDSLLFAAVR